MMTARHHKTQLASRRESVIAEHRSGAGGAVTCSALTHAADEVIRAVFSGLDSRAHQCLTVFAIGGYGRGELCPYSDIDIMVLCREDSDKNAGVLATDFLHALWDAGIDVGHSVRTIPEAMALQGVSVDAWTSMLERRYLCGSATLQDNLRRQITRAVAANPDVWLINGIFADVEQRHGRYGHSVKLLEPNIKKSAGGLRDLHTIFWLYLGTDVEIPNALPGSTPRCIEFLSWLSEKGVITPEEHSTSALAYDFLLRTRHAMHVRRDSLHDTLEYSLQLEVAEQLAYGPKAEASSVELFMRDYYRHARVLFQLNQRLSRRFQEIIEPPQKEDATRLGNSLLLVDGELSVIPSCDRYLEITDMFEAFALAAEHDATMDFRLRGVIERSRDLLVPETCANPALASRFKRILGSRNVATTLRTMNELDILGRYIPEFGALVTFFQHNVYHYFTADEHTLVALENAENLRGRRNVLQEVFRNLRHKEILYAAILLHDIAKPIGVADHERTGVSIAENILRRLGMDEIIPDVTFLIRHHLDMEQVAFRRNIHDPETIREFAAKFDRPEQLDYLYVLTYADLSAVHINVWTDWKASLLQDLYLHTGEVLRRNLRGKDIVRFHESRREAAVLDIVDRLSGDIPREHIEEHFQGIQQSAYPAIFTEEEIAQHIRYSRSEEKLSTIFSQYEGYTEVTVIAEDAPFALSHFCAVLSANDANIFDANIFTREDGTIIDRFRVCDTTSRQHLETRVCTKIGEELRQVAAGTLEIDRLFQAHRRKWKRKPKVPRNPNIRIDVQFEENPRYTILDVYAPDSVGFLYRVTEAISKLGMDIHFAKIATRMDGIVDAFYVLDRNGERITERSRQDQIREQILRVVRDISEEQLSDLSP